MMIALALVIAAVVPDAAAEGMCAPLLKGAL